MSNHDDMPDIPDFLKRPPLTPEQYAKVFGGGEKAAAPVKVKTKKESDAEDREKQIDRIANRRWREWKPGEVVEGKVTVDVRPRESTYRKIVAKEWEEKGW